MCSFTGRCDAQHSSKLTCGFELRASAQLIHFGDKERCEVWKIKRDGAHADAICLKLYFHDIASGLDPVDNGMCGSVHVGIVSKDLSDSDLGGLTRLAPR